MHDVWKADKHDDGRRFHGHSDGQASGSRGEAAGGPAEPQEEQEGQEQEAKHNAHGTFIKPEDLEDGSSGQEDQSSPAHSHKQARGAESRAEQPSRGERQKERKTEDRHQDDDKEPREEDTGGGGLALAKNLRAKRVARSKELALLQAEKETEARHQTNDQNPTEKDTGDTDTTAAGPATGPRTWSLAPAGKGTKAPPARATGRRAEPRVSPSS